MASRLDQLPGGPDAALGLPGYWYVVAPEGRLADPGSLFSVCGRLAGPETEGLARRSGYGWIWLGPAEPGAGPPRLDILDQADLAFEMRTVSIRADWRLVLENSLDLAHSATLHAWTSPVWLLGHLRPGSTVEAEYGRTPDGLVVDARHGGQVVFRHVFQLPDRLRLTLYPDTWRPLDVLVHHVPEEAGRSRMEILVARRRWPLEGRRRPDAPVPFRPGSLRLHQQDRAIVEAQQRAWERQGPAAEAHCAADAYTLLLRRVLADAATGGPLPPAGDRRLVTVRV